MTPSLELSGYNLAVSFLVLPLSIIISDELIEIDDAFIIGFTITVQCATTSLVSVEVAFTIVLPGATPTTSPSEYTFAIVGSSDVHSIPLIDAFSGWIVATILCVSPTYMVILPSLNVIEVTGLITLIATEALTPLPSAASAVITTVPGAMPVTLPLLVYSCNT